MKSIKTNFNKEISYCNDDYVAVRVLEDPDKTLEINGIYLPSTFNANGRLSFAQVLKVGKHANEIYGIEEGDYVIIDFLATYGHSAPIATLKYDSVICKTDSNAQDLYPLKDMCFVEVPKIEPVSNVNGVYIPNYSERLLTGKITKKNFNDDFINIGDTIILSKGADDVQYNNKTVKIYKKDMIVAVVNDNNEKNI